MPRTWRTISPRSTVSVKTTAASTLGAAGSMRDTTQANATNAVAATDPKTIRRMRFLRAYPMRALSTLQSF